MDCLDFEKLYWLKVYGEDVPGGEDGIAQHLENCTVCQNRTAEIDRMHALLTVRTASQPKPDALTNARQMLAARLLSEKKKSFGLDLGERFGEWIDRIIGPRWQPAIALGMLLIGLVIGRVVFYPSAGAIAQSSQLSFNNPVELERHYISERILQDESRISDLRVSPSDSESGILQVSFRGARDYVVEGNPEDDLIRELLTWAIKNEENSGSRLHSVRELSKASAINTTARDALAYAAINDGNDGVRLRALEALGAGPQDKLTEQVILGALLKDPNPAVRIRAIDLLLSENGIDKSESLLLTLAEADSNDYVRMRARQAIRESDYDIELVDYQE